jgi:hypothetical protein
MYKRVNVYDTDSERWMDYTVTSNSTEFNGYVEDFKGRRYEFTKPSEDYEYKREIPVFHTSVGIGRKTCVKPSILKRRFLQCRRDEYKHLFTNVIRKTVEETHDVYYNRERDKFIDKVSKSNYFREYYYV